MAPSSTSSTRSTAPTLPVRGEGLPFRPNCCAFLIPAPRGSVGLHVTLGLCVVGLTSYPFPVTPKETREGHLTLRQGPCQLAIRAPLGTGRPLLVAVS